MSDSDSPPRRKRSSSPGRKRTSSPPSHSSDSDLPPRRKRSSSPRRKRTSSPRSMSDSDSPPRRKKSSSPGRKRTSSPRSFSRTERERDGDRDMNRDHRKAGDAYRDRRDSGRRISRIKSRSRSRERTRRRSRSRSRSRSPSPVRPRDREYGEVGIRDNRNRCSRSENDDNEKGGNRGSCFAFQKGACTRGTSCRFLHDIGGRGNDEAGQDIASIMKGRGDDKYGPKTGTKEVWGNIAQEEEIENANKPQEIDEKDKVKANFGVTGALAKDERTGNVYNGVVLKWSEPLDAAMPNKNWRFYVFKDNEIVETLYLHRQSAYLAGKETKVADIVLAHPSCSRQHAVIQFRAVQREIDGRITRVTLPYIMDLASVHKTYLNGTEIEDSRYYELREKDLLKFGGSSREYVLMVAD